MGNHHVFGTSPFACKDDYRAAGIPMLPVVVGDEISTRTILAHAVALSLLSILPLWYGMSWLYGVGAIAGGTFFIHACLKLARKRDRESAWRAFAASIVQLGLLMLGAILDRLLLA